MNKLFTRLAAILVVLAAFLTPVTVVHSASAATTSGVVVQGETRSTGIIGTWLGRVIPGLRLPGRPPVKPLTFRDPKPGESAADYAKAKAAWERANTPRGDRWRGPTGWDNMA